MSVTGRLAGRGPFIGAVAAIILAGCAAYHNSLAVPFVLDDAADIAGNATIRHLWSLGTVLSPPRASGLTVSGRPLLNLTLAINYAVGGTEVRGYHALNLLIHVLAGLTLFGIVRRTLARLHHARSLFLAWTSAILWTLHPLQTEAVTYVIQRAESLMGLFYLLTVYGFIRAADRTRWRGWWCALSVAACLAGMATKEVMASAPLLVFLYDRTFVSGTFRQAWSNNRALHLGLAASWLLLGYLAVATGDRGMTAGFQSGIPWSWYALAQCKAIVLYLARSVWPHPQVFDYGPASGLAWNGLVLPAALVAALLALTLVASLRQELGARALGFAGVWFFAILAPSSSVLPIATQAIAEHRMYLPLAAVITVAVFGLQAAFGWRSPVFCGALALALGVVTEQRNQVYRSALGLWADTVAARPGNARAHFNLAVELARVPDRLPDALAQYEASLRIDPGYAAAHYNLGVELARIPGRMGEAIAHYEKALQIDPTNAQTHYNLAVELGRKADGVPAAIVHARAALRLKPDWAEAHNSLGILLSTLPDREPDAAAEFTEALRLDPDFAEAHCNLGVELARIPGRHADAVTHYREALGRKPDYIAAHYNLANELAKDPSGLAEAIEHYEAVLRLQPDFAEAHVNAAVSYAKAGRIEEAIRHLETALRINPNLPGVRPVLENLKTGWAR